jgi:N-acetylglucosaminyl-diphospho-decaprenol L-rhamnosyltransferase
MLLSIIIVTYNNVNEIIPCLSSLPWTHLPMEVYLIDNDSTDQTKEKINNYINMHSQVPLKSVWNLTNNGYAHGINQGLSLSRGEYVLILGPDTWIYPNSIKKMIQYLEKNPQVGMVAPQLLDSHGRIQPSCRRFPSYKDVLIELTGLPRLFPARFQPKWKMPDFDHQSQREVDQPEATCLMIRKKVINEVGVMDERFPIFFNDVDWCHRVRKAGWKVVFYPESQVQHKRGSSIVPLRIPMIWKSHQGFFRYFQKWSPSMKHKMLNQGLGFLLIMAAVFRSFLFLYDKKKGM